jgi:hypothetical protein
MVADDKNSGFQNSPTFLLEKLNQIYADEQRTRKFDAETKKPNKQQPALLKSTHEKHNPPRPLRRIAPPRIEQRICSNFDPCFKCLYGRCNGP